MTVLSNNSKTARRDQKSVVSLERKRLFFLLLWRNKGKKSSEQPRMNSDVWCDWGEKPELVFGYSSWMPANRKGRRVTFPAAASSCPHAAASFWQSRGVHESCENGSVIGTECCFFPSFWFSFLSARGRIHIINPEMPPPPLPPFLKIPSFKMERRIK